jgi:hypothetical protein
MPAFENAPIHQLIPIVQSAISPMIMISGIGLLLISMSNRLSRNIDRIRKLVEMRESGDPKAEAQIRIIWRRARLLRVSMTLAAVSILFAALNIILLFLAAVFALHLNGAIILLFILGMLSIIGAMVLYVFEINQSIKAIGMELQK